MSQMMTQLCIVPNNIVGKIFIFVKVGQVKRGLIFAGSKLITLSESFFHKNNRIV